MFSLLAKQRHTPYIIIDIFHSVLYDINILYSN